MGSLLILGAKLVNEGRIEEKDVLVDNTGRIARIEGDLSSLTADETIDSTGHYLLPGLIDDPRFADNQSRNANVDALKAEMEAALTGESTDHWLEILEEAGVPSGPINDVAQALDDPQVRARNMVVEMLDQSLPKPLIMAGNPIKSSAYPDPTTRPAAPAWCICGDSTSSAGCTWNRPKLATQACNISPDCPSSSTSTCTQPASPTNRLCNWRDASNSGDCMCGKPE